MISVILAHLRLVVIVSLSRCLTISQFGFHTISNIRFL